MTTNNQGGAYEVPSLDGIDGADQADAAIRQLNAAWAADPQHPYINGNHAQNRDFTEYANRLYRIKYEEADERPAKEQAMAAGLEAQQEQQAGLVERGKKIMETLADLNFTEDEIPADISEVEVFALEMQGLGAQGKIDEVITAISRRLEQNRQLPDSIRQNLGLWKEMTETAEGGQWADKLLLLALREIVDAERGRLGLKPRTGKKNGNKDSLEGD